ncbi:MAG: HAD-IIB family hydrolase [Candidatus Thiodiazotropha taylori]|nr:HAD-IIB family hydrolase [Candidatus Thiodiazotropha taylori]MCG8067767.1 HAD-IIB family hydrolase [Candidatus Thiodiazotropha taylori]
MYICLISVHGLIRGHDLELGRDADTGGQTKYVVDLAKALAERDGVSRVDLVTRRVVDSEISDDYAEPLELLSEKAKIVRIEAGPEGYLAKETLWDHLDSFMDNLLNWLKSQPRMPDIVHTHYADAGYVGVRLSHLLGVPLVHTGHSLGRDKQHQLLAKGFSRKEIRERYNMDRRVEAEEEVLANADLVITSTHNEIEEQYSLYNHYQPDNMAVIPPGTDLTQFHPPSRGDNIHFRKTLARFLRDPDKPIILALSRPDERKNILTLLEVYGESSQLQSAANLVIVAGNRDDIRDMESGPQSVMTDILMTIDLYDLYGRVAVPKRHLAKEVPEIYRLTALSEGVFVNPALTEPFGLTLLEAAASGLPLIATENGGPVDIIGNCNNGLLVDPLNKKAIRRSLLKILHDNDVWQKFARNGLNGVRKHYSWKAHAKKYLAMIKPMPAEHERLPTKPPKHVKYRYRDRAIFTDLDQNLLGNPTGLKRFIQVVRDNRKCATFGIATGRRLDDALSIMKKFSIPIPDVLITSLGTKIHYTQGLSMDDYWGEHIDHLWQPKGIRRVLADLPGIKPQPKQDQSFFKIGYHYDPNKAPSVDEINALLRKEELTCNVIHAFGQFLDVLPSRASKGQALRYVAQRLDVPLEHILVAGGSGSDEDMMRGNTLAVVVANRHHEELSHMIDLERIYFAKQSHALGILEAIDHYDFFRSCHVPEEQ